jgi:hypothetical protein
VTDSDTAENDDTAREADRRVQEPLKSGWSVVTRRLWNSPEEGERGFARSLRRKLRPPTDVAELGPNVQL